MTTVFDKKSTCLDRSKLRSSTIDETIREKIIGIVPVFMEEISRSKERLGNKYYSPIRLRSNLKQSQEDVRMNSRYMNSVMKARQRLGNRTRHLAGIRKFSTYSVDDRYQYIDGFKENDRIDQVKLQEILSELEDFEIKYADRIKEKYKTNNK